MGVRVGNEKQDVGSFRLGVLLTNIGDRQCPPTPVPTPLIGIEQSPCTQV